MKKAIEFSFTVLRPRRYLAVLLSVLCLTVVAPLIQHTIAFKAVLGAMIIICSIFASFSITNTWRQRLRVLGLALLTSLMWTCSALLPGGFFHAALFEVMSSAVCLLFFANAVHLMLEDILTGPINSNRVCGAICVYILIGFCFALLHTMIATANPLAYTEATRHGIQSFKDIPLSDRYSPFVYFSFCTLSTVGYGDIVPISRIARTITWLEAVVGQFYMAVLVARLVGLHIARKQSEQELFNDSRDTGEFRKRAAQLSKSQQEREVALID